MRTTVWTMLAATALTACTTDTTPPDDARSDESTVAESSAETIVDYVSLITDATSTLNMDRVVAADKEPSNWLSHGRTLDEQRHSPLDQITAENASELGLAWTYDTGSRRGLEATPIVVDGVMFSTGSWSTVQALDAKTGALIWEFDPQVPKAWGQYACCDVVNRGVAVWEGRVYVGVLDGRLIALNAATGSVDWEVLTIDPDRPYTITGAPRIVKGKVIIGNGGAELGVRGYITAYDAETGAQEWRFFTVPGDPSKPFESRAIERAAETWHGDDWWTVGGGGTVWDSMAYDPELNLLYVGVGNGSPWTRYTRSPGGGDNLYLSSILAINPDNAALVWHYQTTPGDNWDYTATQHIILMDREINGVMRKLLVQAPKNGFFYVLDRTDGRFISAEPYVPVNWASHIDPKTGVPVELPDGQYINERKLVYPGPLGGHNWQPMTYSPDTGLVYIPAIDIPFSYGQDHEFKHIPGRWNLGLSIAEAGEPPTIEETIESIQALQGRLLAWDPIEQREVWRVEHASTWNGGLLSTAGNLVFQGRSDGMFAAYASDTGRLVWETPVHTGIIAAPVTYAIDGEQYIAIVAGWGGAFSTTAGAPRHKGNVLEEGRVLAFKLGGTAKMPVPEVLEINIPEPPEIAASEEEIETGRQLYSGFCSTCHGAGVTSGSQITDLKYISSTSHARWNSIVLDGLLQTAGMPPFDDVLDADSARAIQAYVIQATKDAITFCESGYPEEYPEYFGTSCTRRSVSN